MDKVDYYLKLVHIYDALSKAEHNSDYQYLKQEIQSEKANLTYLINKNKPSIFDLIANELQKHEKPENILRAEL